MNVFKAVHEGLQLKYPRARTNLVIYIYILKAHPCCTEDVRAILFVRCILTLTSPKPFAGTPRHPFHTFPLLIKSFVTAQALPALWHLLAQLLSSGRMWGPVPQLWRNPDNH